MIRLKQLNWTQLNIKSTSIDTFFLFCPFNYWLYNLHHWNANDAVYECNASINWVMCRFQCLISICVCVPFLWWTWHSIAMHHLNFGHMLHSIAQHTLFVCLFVFAMKFCYTIAFETLSLSTSIDIVFGLKKTHRQMYDFKRPLLCILVWF